MDIKAMKKQMHAYFQLTIDQAKGTYRDDSGKMITKPKRQIASDAGLCLNLKLDKEQLYAMQYGTDEEKDFFKDMLLWYEIAADAMYAASMIDAKAYSSLKEKFKEKSVETDDKHISLVLPEYNAPDDWEDYKDLRRIADENETSMRGLKKVLERAIKAGLLT